MPALERLLTVEFGPSRSKRFKKAVTEAQSGPGECSELEPGRYRVSFLLDEDAAIYTALARLLERVRHWRATEVYSDEEQVSVFHAKEMAWCASFQLSLVRELPRALRARGATPLRYLSAIRRRAGSSRRLPTPANLSQPRPDHL